jgi:hypothetical protein
MGESAEFPGWEADALGDLTLTVTIGGEEIRLATVIRVPAGAGDLYETYIGPASPENQVGRHDASQERAVRKAEDYLIARLRRLA